jgi:2-polyprenyl-3-methyl-5-hydroxy-6-metoxy-1,4-benzoquinol methylase
VRACLRPTDRMLEVGCGTGSTALALADAVAGVVATDSAPGMIAIAQNKPNPCGVRFAVADIAAAGADDAPFDVVAAFNLLHLTPDPRAAAATLRARLRPGGLLMAKTPLLEQAAWWIAPAIAGLRLIGKAPPGLRRMTAAQLDAAIVTAGFAIEQVHDYPGPAPTRLHVARRA